MFGRRKKEQTPVEAGTELQAGTVESDLPPAVVPRPQGPWDADDAPEDDVHRIDLGGLEVPVPPDTEVRVDVSPEGQVVAATLVRGASTMQINAFAAPRSSGIWVEVRAEIGAALREGGGGANDADGPCGVELCASVPTEIAGQGSVLAPARFLGVDGPRWFLRALVTGPAATDRAQAAELEAAFKDIVVHRGTEAMAVRSPLPLRLPPAVTEQPAAPGAAEQPSLELPERGPEITERR